MSRLSPAEIEARTPPDRYRFADFLRVAAILIVVFGHWLLLIVRVDDGRLAYDVMLDELDWAPWTTWVFQVMPVFFIVGGYANAKSLRSAREKGTRGTDWLRARAMRLYWPVLPLLVVWTGIAAALAAVGASEETISLSTQVVLVPAWFLTAYLGVVSLAPATYLLHERYGLKALAVMAGCAAVVDFANRLGGVPGIGWSTYLFVWVSVHQIGYVWEAGRLPATAKSRLLMGALGYLALTALVFGLGYDLAMVGAGGTGSFEQTNTTPPSIALLALGIGQLGLLLAVEEPITRWLHRPAVWARVAMMGAVIMTVYLWHMTAMVAVAAAAFPTGIWPPTDGVDLEFWLTRPIWFLALLTALSLLVAAFRRFEKSPHATPTSLPGTRGRIKAALGVLSTAGGLGLLIVGGLYSERGPLGIPIVPLSLLGVGLGALGVIRLRGGRSLGADSPTPD
jgi:hypothetical protein